MECRKDKKGSSHSWSVQPPVFGPAFNLVSDEDFRRRLGGTGGGVMMNVLEKLKMLKRRLH